MLTLYRPAAETERDEAKRPPLPVIAICHGCGRSRVFRGETRAVLRAAIADSGWRCVGVDEDGVDVWVCPARK